ncbi:PEF-CTERM sorting domain-containing protein [Methanolobus sp. WCC4]|uniref:PEF-CTERM sorting domain-containing protein n=1 Tax=Methanolobus sp. WCC4 TaxID=3125784 RepID=UPI0030F85DE2
MKIGLIIMLLLTLFIPLAGATVGSDIPTYSDCDNVIIKNVGSAASEIGDYNDYKGTLYSSFYKLGDRDEWNGLDGWEQVGDSNEYTRSIVTDGNLITITAYYDPDEEEFYSFDWTSTCPLGVVLVKAGNCYNIYDYDEATSGTGLIAVSGIGISHTTFGWYTCGGIPEFPSIAFPIAAIIGLAFIFQRKKE